jgi:hypothetical protein
MFADPWNPSSTEVRAWAYTADSPVPCQDWDLSLSWASHERDYLEFAADKDCPHSDFFLCVVYRMVGDAVRSRFIVASEPLVRGFIELASNHKSKRLRMWRERALYLLKNPEEFNYDAWCAGGLARDEH